MTDILKLIKVDILKLYSAKTLFVMVVFVPFLIVLSKDFFALPFIISVYAASFGILSYDEMYKSDYFYASLPVSRSEIVIAKYLFCILTILYVSLLTIAISILGFLQIDTFIFNVTLIFSCFFISVMNPLILYIGAAKGRYFSLGLYILGIIFITDNDFLLENTNTIINIFSSTIYTILLAIVLLLISFFTSIALYNKKESKD